MSTCGRDPTAVEPSSPRSLTSSPGTAETGSPDDQRAVPPSELNPSSWLSHRSVTDRSSGGNICLWGSNLPDSRAVHTSSPTLDRSRVCSHARPDRMAQPLLSPDAVKLSIGGTIKWLSSEPSSQASGGSRTIPWTKSRFQLQSAPDSYK
jgi:hypothetical protein